MIIAQTEAGDIKYRINQGDEYNFTLEKWEAPHVGKRGRGAGKLVDGKWAFCGYYSSPQHAAKAIIKHGMATIPEEFEEVVRILNTLEKNFEKLYEQKRIS